MNYCIAAFAVILLISTIQWFVDGRKNYKGPVMDESALVNAQIISGIDQGFETERDQMEKSVSASDSRK